MSSAASCTIPANPDISGIGVRVAIYVQNLLSFIPAVWALWDGEVTDYELESVETQSTTILITAFAILLSAIAQAQDRTNGLSSFHAGIVLDLSWMNNTNTFIYFLLYVQHKSQPGPNQIRPNLSSWITHLKGKTLILISPDSAEGQEGTDHFNVTHRSTHSSITLIFRKIVLLLGSLHLSIMATLGIWLWSDPHSFGNAQSCISVSTVILGNSLPLGSSALRAWSIAIYSMFLAPGLNLLIPMALFLSIFVLYQKWYDSRHSDSGNVQPTAFSLKPNRAYPTLNLRQLHCAFGECRSFLPMRILPILVGLVILFAINLIFLIDIELTIQQNRAHQVIGESDWTFGQILAMLLLFLPLRDLVETLLARRETQRKEELAYLHKKHIDEHTGSLRNAIREGAEMQTLWELVQKGANIDAEVEDCKFSTTLQLAVWRGAVDFVAALLENGADPNIRGGEYGTALQAAWDRRSPELVKLLLDNGANPNIRDSGDSPILESAVCEGQLEVVRLLLQKGANPNIKGGEYSTALQAACAWGRLEIVELLLANHADPDIQGGEHGTALVAASAGRRLGIVKLLLASGADPQIGGGQYGTALGAASFSGEPEIVKLLLDSGADPNMQGKRTIHILACYWGGLEIVKLLLNAGADPNIQGGEYGTALQAASSVGHLDIVKILLASHADPNIQGGEYGTALGAASAGRSLEIVQLLLENGANFLEGGRYGTALGAASFGGEPKIVSMLLDSGADPNILGGEYGTALGAASFRGAMEIVKLLLARGANPDIQGGQYGTALGAASVGRAPEIVKLLLDRCVDPNLQGGNHGTALQAASSAGHLNIVEILLEAGANPDIEGGRYGTALQAAASEGDLEIVTLLLENGADPNIQGGKYCTALQGVVCIYQCSENSEFPLGVVWDIVELLLDHGADPNVKGGLFGSALQAASGRKEIEALLCERGAIA
ncbi:Multiple ankyrin repeats single kh domain [Mycena venus]|uniref:Multiple ankyrin repeats single kh domain n=1 Tax=Mycena venus TaxID=2733690 RepID=A0A8H6XE02_9AGAR|nr:Multiple ankyrin repeats single kh domain [Mycena venus]